MSTKMYGLITKGGGGKGDNGGKKLTSNAFGSDNDDSDSDEGNNITNNKNNDRWSRKDVERSIREQAEKKKTAAEGEGEGWAGDKR